MLVFGIHKKPQDSAMYDRPVIDYPDTAAPNNDYTPMAYLCQMETTL